MTKCLGQEAVGELLNDRLDLGLKLLGHLSLADLREELLLRGVEVLLELVVPLDDPLDGDLVQHTVDTGVHNGYLDLSRDGSVLTLLQELWIT